MELKKLIRKNTDNNKLIKRYEIFDLLLSEILKKDIPDIVTSMLNQEVDAINNFTGTDQALKRKLRNSR